MTTLTLSGKTLHEKRNVLVNLSNRALSPDAESLAFSLLYLIKPQTDEFDAQLKKLQTDAQAIAEQEDGPDKLAALKALQKRSEALDAKEFTIKTPKTRLAVKHLPKDRKGLDGNAQGNAAIRYALTPEFFEEPTDEPEAPTDE